MYLKWCTIKFNFYNNCIIISLTNNIFFKHVKHLSTNLSIQVIICYNITCTLRTRDTYSVDKFWYYHNKIIQIIVIWKTNNVFVCIIKHNMYVKTFIFRWLGLVYWNYKIIVVGKINYLYRQRIFSWSHYCLWIGLFHVHYRIVRIVRGMM